MNKPSNRKHFRPSISIEEFAENHSLDAVELLKLVKCTGTLKVRFFRGITAFYHISELNHWYDVNSLRIVANAKI